MVFNDTENYQGLIQDIDFLLFGDGTTLNTAYSLEDRTRNINIALDEIVAELYKADPNYQWDDTTNTDYPIARRSLRANQKDYTLLDDALVIHRIRMKNENGDLVTLDPVLRRELTDDDLNATGSPEKYYKVGGIVFPIPVPDYGFADGIELEFQRGGNHFVSTDTTKTPGFNSQFHRFLSTDAALRFAIANGMKEKVAQLRADKEVIRNQVREFYERRSPDERPKLQLVRPNPKKYGF